MQVFGPCKYLTMYLDEIETIGSMLSAQALKQSFKVFLFFFHLKQRLSFANIHRAMHQVSEARHMGLGQIFYNGFFFRSLFGIGSCEKLGSLVTIPPPIGINLVDSLLVVALI